MAPKLLLGCFPFTGASRGHLPGSGCAGSILAKFSIESDTFKELE